MLAPLGYVLSPQLLQLVHASPEVRAEALPYLRTMFVCSIGQLLYFMLAGALRAAGDARTPLRIGHVDHRAERRAQHGADPRARADSRRSARRARRSARRSPRRWPRASASG